MSFTVRDGLDRAQPAEVPDLLHAIGFGSLLHALVNPRVETITVTDNVGTLEDKAIVIQAVYATDGTTTGPMVVIPADLTPTTGQVAFDGQKTLTFAADDGVEQAKVVYVKRPEDADVLDAEMPEVR